MRSPPSEEAVHHNDSVPSEASLLSPVGYESKVDAGVVRRVKLVSKSRNVKGSIDFSSLLLLPLDRVTYGSPLGARCLR